ncbi:hypothetical protein [Streptomyces sp. KL116D]
MCGCREERCSALGVIARVLGEAYNCLVAYGQMWLYLPDEHPRSTLSYPL